MRKIGSLLTYLVLVALYSQVAGQSNNALSIYEGERIHAVSFVFINEPTDALTAMNIRQKVENTFLIYPQSHYGSFMADYYLSQINALPFVESADVVIDLAGEGGINLTVNVALTADESKAKRERNIFKNIRSFPVIFSGGRSFGSI